MQIAGYYFQTQSSSSPAQDAWQRCIVYYNVITIHHFQDLISTWSDFIASFHIRTVSASFCRTFSWTMCSRRFFWETFEAACWLGTHFSFAFFSQFIEFRSRFTSDFFVTCVRNWATRSGRIVIRKAGRCGTMQNMFYRDSYFIAYALQVGCCSLSPVGGVQFSTPICWSSFCDWCRFFVILGVIPRATICCLFFKWQFLVG